MRHRPVVLAFAGALLAACVEDRPGVLEPSPDMAMAAAAGGTIGHFGHAFGTQAFIDREEGLVHLGPSAVSSLACTAGQPPPQENTVLTVEHAPLVRTGVVNTRVEPLVTANRTATRASTDIADVEILGGLIRARAVRAVSTAFLGAQGYRASAAGSAFVDLVVAGVPIAATVPRNTRIDLPGVGYVILNEQKKTLRSDRAELQVTMIRVVVQDETVGVPWGTNLIVSHAQASTRAIAGVLSGLAYGSEVEGPAVRMGRSVLLNVPCLGTEGKVMKLPGAEVRFHDILDLGAVRSDVMGTVAPTQLEVETGATITDVNVLDGLITARMIAARASMENVNGIVSVSTAGSKLLDLRVDGQALANADVGRNTSISIANLGTLWLKRVVREADRIEVRMIELVVEVPNEYDLPIGTVIRVGVANAGPG